MGQLCRRESNQCADHANKNGEVLTIVLVHLDVTEAHCLQCCTTFLSPFEAEQRVRVSFVAVQQH